MCARGIVPLLAGWYGCAAQSLIEKEHVYEDNGKKLHGWLIYQDIPGDPKRPGLLMFPGFWGQGAGESEREYAREYAKRGMLGCK